LLKKTKRKPPHLRYTEKELKVPQLNGIRPSGVQKLPNRKKGKQFVDDGEGMRAIMAMVMAEKEGDVESKMMRARQLEEVREARKAEMERRAESKKAGLEGRKEEIKMNKSKKKRRGDVGLEGAVQSEEFTKKPKKRVSFG
jgi:60S ribosomal subunit assembly/export protein LOC1